MKKSLVLLGILILMPRLEAAQGRVSPKTLHTIRHLAIQHNGRHKPVDSFARETVQLITGAPRLGNEDPVVTVLAILADPERWQAQPLIAVPFIPLREALGMVPPPPAWPNGPGSPEAIRGPSDHAVGGGMDQQATHVSYNDLIATRKLMRLLPSIVEKQERNEKLSMVENETMDVFQRLVALNGLFEQNLRLVPPWPAGIREWSPILQPQGHSDGLQTELRESWTALLTALRASSPETVEAAATRLANVLHAANPSDDPPAWRLRLEVLYNQARPFHVARFLYALAVVALLLSLAGGARWAAPAGVAALGAAFAVHAAGILLRVILGGRPPVSNFFETLLWLPFVAVMLSLIFERIYRVGYFGLAAAILAAITLLLADAVPLDSSISPVVAVLHSNLWLTVHVLTIVASYGALALAAVLAHVYGALYLARRLPVPSRTGRQTGGTHPALPSLDTFLYRTIQVGVVLLAGGVMLGAVWANASWGRYWGWDPKETWALITLLWFLAVLHGRFAGWLRGVGVALSTIGGFFLLLMTYYGVSFYLVGLHSYAGGHAKPLPSLLIAYLIAEMAFLLLLGSSALFRKRLPQA